MKFEALLRRADDLGLHCIATGHYARVDCEGGRWRLLRGRDRRKDQSYVLYPLSQEVLSRLLLPVGEYDKAAVRALAEARVAGGDAVEPQIVRPAQQGLELHPAVALDAGVGGAPGLVPGHELVHHLLPEEAAEVKHVEVHAQPPRRGPGVLHVLQGAAAPLPANIPIVVEAQGAANGPVPRLLEQNRRGRAVHAAAHAHQNRLHRLRHQPGAAGDRV